MSQNPMKPSWTETPVTIMYTLKIIRADEIVGTKKRFLSLLALAWPIYAAFLPKCLGFAQTVLQCGKTTPILGYAVLEKSALLNKRYPKIPISNSKKQYFSKKLL